ncbi:hypothetical protein I302_107264 [Kwoniella bestiolae CBS 10118]|uniref:ML-like domain-containing protein n=1 Tax=Kwoniella bestiolae CBS 10118 TaxID=1296100 RepID=A0A1B9FZ25_9TREE|nr:hypothetical protein I302_07000 [Kwoniella bestiolae CBS 10118]OCF24014.1 hypothetical protein I302_07000 [Kwoniella bestiolae CBS 10118]
MPSPLALFGVLSTFVPLLVQSVPIDVSVPSWTIVRPYNSPSTRVVGSNKLTGDLNDGDNKYVFYYDVYEKTFSAADDFHTGKEPYFTLSCVLERKEGPDTPSQFVLERQSKWVSGAFGGNLRLRCPKEEFKCLRDKCEGEYALPEGDVNTDNL